MMREESNYSLLPYNTFGIDARCRRFVECSSVEEARDVLSSLTDADRPLLLLGGGSNLLLTRDFPGTVVHSAIMGIHATQNGGEVLVRCGSGETFDHVVDHCVSHGWHGMENLSLIPGEVGASAVQNIGAYGAEAKDVISTIEAVEIATGTMRVFRVEECGYAYRQSRFKAEWKDKYFITHVTYRLTTAFTPSLDYGNIRAELQRRGIGNPTATELRQTIIDIRNAKLPDPKVEGNAGSFFMNPIIETSQYDALKGEYPDIPCYPVDDTHVKVPAGWMIDHCGWKGRTVGKAGVHSKQALVLVNRGGATGEDIVNLCRLVMEDVKKKFGIDIHPEVNIL